MSNPVTEEMISALIDGELSSTDRAMVEKAISTDESLRRIYESYQDAGNAVQESAAWVESTVSLPTDFTSRVMSEIQSGFATDQSYAGQDINKIESDEVAEANSILTTRPKDDSVWSVRTLVEIVAAVAAIIVIVVVWQGQGNNPDDIGGMAKQDNQNEVENKKPKNGVQALGSKDGNFKKNTGGGNKSENKDPSVGKVASRKFSVFVDAATRPSVDRFWILNNYEVTAPEGTDPKQSGVNVLLIDSKKKDAVEFFSQLKKWDSDFQVFQQAKSGNASWLAPFDVDRASQAEGDFWTLQIVLIKR